MNLFRIFVIGLIVNISGCVMFSSSDVTVRNLNPSEKGQRVVTIFGDSPYFAEMNIALVEQGFKVKAMPSQREVTKTDGDTTSRFNEASARWGVSLQSQGTGLTCAFTDYAIYNFTLTLTDLQENQVSMVLKQKGSDGPCTTVKPVFETLAKSLADNW